MRGSNMRRPWPPIAATMVAASLLAILTGCGNLEARLSAASSEIGRQNAGVSLPGLPSRCRDKMPRVTPRAGEKWRAVQGRWEIAADGEDRRTRDCAAFYDDVKGGFARAAPPVSPNG